MVFVEGEACIIEEVGDSSNFVKTFCVHFVFVLRSFCVHFVKTFCEDIL